MYSILIQNKKTTELFQQMYPMFMNALNNNAIAPCLWNEAGTTIDTAVPELYDLIDDKEEWRAIIVRMEDDVEMQQFTACPGNPYDFMRGDQPAGTVQESANPLVRLTQMLGGVPAPEIQFEAVTINDPNKAPRIIYQPVANPKAQEEYAALCDKYHFEGRQPSEIVLLSIQEVQTARDALLRKAWRNGKEINSSDFWKRNGYPSGCRFAYLPIERQGRLQRVEDLFRAWTVVLLLATNQLNSSTFQAYRLHELRVDLNKERMTQAMQDCINRAVSAKTLIAKSIQLEIERKILEEIPPVEYKIEAPVVLKLPAKLEYKAKADVFKLTAHSTTSDFAAWREMETSSEQGLATITVCADRALDQTAARVRNYCQFTPEEIYPLQQYQEEDFKTELAREHEDIFTLRSQLPVSQSLMHKQLHALSQKVKKELSKRVTTRQALQVFGIVAALFVLSLLPALVFGSGSAALPIAMGVGLVLFALTEVFVLFAQKMQLHEEISVFNNEIIAIVTHITENLAMFSKYMSGVASYMHGSSFLSLLAQKDFSHDAQEVYKQNHLAALNVFLLSLKEWCAAFHLRVYVEEADLIENLTVDTDLSPSENPLYTFEDGAIYKVPVNYTGDTIEAPFQFIERLNVTREELYDDAK